MLVSVTGPTALIDRPGLDQSCSSACAGSGSSPLMMVIQGPFIFHFGFAWIGAPRTGAIPKHLPHQQPKQFILSFRGQQWSLAVEAWDEG